MDPRPLPPGFTSQYDPNTQRYFYVDTNTGVSQWHHPLDMKPPSVESSGSQFPNPNQYPLGFASPSSFPSSGHSDQRPPPSALPQPSNYPPTTYGKGMPDSSAYPSYSQPPPSNYPPSNYPPSNYPPSYPQSGPEYYGGGTATAYPGHQAGHGKDKGMDKTLLGLGAGAVGGVIVGGLASHAKHKKYKYKHKHKGWKGKWKGWKGKGWKGKGWKGWKGKGWKGYK